MKSLGEQLTILLPTDLTEHSRQALEVASLLARARGGKLILLHVVPREVPVMASGGVRELYRAEHYQADLEQYRAEMSQRLERLAIPERGVRVERRMAEGEVAGEILKAAAAGKCDMIVMGAVARESSPRPLGSAAEEVLQKAHCPVLIVRN